MTLFRAIKIIRVCARYRLDALLPNSKWLWVISLLAYINPICWTVTRRYNRGQRIRLALETLGPIYIKFGQMLSTRRDLLPDDIAQELAKLQDQVPPFSFEQVKATLQQNYQKPLDEVFKDFDTNPLASASIAQVHTAILSDNTEVVVKVLRPNVERIVQKDIALLYTIAKLLNRIWREAYRVRPLDIVIEYEKTINNELDLIREAGNASALRRNFSDSEIIYIPKVYFDFTYKNVLVIERVYGVKISDTEIFKEKKVNMKKLAHNGVEIFMTQVFRDNFFHADMHPGNVLVDIRNPENPVYCAIDFGIVGALSEDDQRYMAENLLGFFERDYRRIAQLHVESGWVPADTSIEDFEGAIRTVSEPIFQKPMSEISFGVVLLRLFQVARQFNMPVQPQLMLLQKTLLNVEGLGRQLYPELDLWDTVYPYLKRWMRERYSIKTMLKKIEANAPLFIEKFPEIPELVYQVLKALAKKA